MKILIVDDHQLILEGFMITVKDAYPNCIVYPANNKEELFKILEDEEIDLLFLDIRLEHSDARDFIKEIRKNHVNLKIVIISSLSDSATIKTLFAQGADGYLLKSDPKEEIIRAVETVLVKDEKFISKSIESSDSQTYKTKDDVNLTPREKEILSLILKGKTSPEIAKELYISEKTVSNHRVNIFIKFDVDNVASLVRKAILKGYL